MKITLLKSLMMVGVFLCFGLSHAQEVTGTVSDASGPLPGASVIVKGTTTGTQTDFDGNFTINAESDATLVFSYIGYLTKEVAVNGQTSISLTLEEDAQQLDEVVIIGYGTTTIKDATGSVTAVTAEDFNTGVISSPEQLIQGKTAGVNISQSSGEPGAGISVNIRGANSVRANNNPLFVVDGIALFGQNTDAAGTSGNNVDASQGSNGDAAVGNPLNFLNPNDIESISILKDASATAIYGSRGANGVVIITTKSGKAAAGGTWEFSSSLSVARPVRKYDLLDADGFLEGIRQQGRDPQGADFGSDTDWQEAVLRSTASTNNNLSYSQNYGSGNVRATFGYQKQFGIVEKSEFERITGRINWNQRFLNDKLKVGIQASIGRNNREQPPLGGRAGFQGDILGAAYSANPTIPNSGNFDPGGGLINPANYLQNTSNITNTNRYLLNGSVEYQFTPELSAKVNVGTDISDSENTSVLSGAIFNVQGISGLGAGTYNSLERQNNLLEVTVNYTKEFDNSRLDALAGYAFQDFRTFGFNSAARGFGSTDLNVMGDDLRSTVLDAKATVQGEFQQFYYGGNDSELGINRLFSGAAASDAFRFNRGVNALVFDNFDNTDELQSFFGRINYTIADKYLFTGTFRADGSSRFGPDNQYGYFPSGAFAWKINEEDFVGDSVSTLKLRLSAGVTGNQDGLGYGNFVIRQRWNALGLNNISQDASAINGIGLGIVSAFNPQLKWETTIDYNLGLDFGFNEDRFSGSIDVYRKDTRDLLILTPPDFPSNAPFRFENVDASVINQGIELALNYDFIRSEDTDFSASFNIAYNDNEIKDFEGGIDVGPINGPGLSGPTAQRFESGQSLFAYYLPVFVGLVDGVPQYETEDGGASAIPEFKQFVGKDALPDITSGLSLNFRHKNWDLSTFFAGQFGFYVYNNTANALFTAGQLNTSRNVTPDVLTSGESPGASTEASDRFLEKGDFVRLQNATIGYNVPLSGEGLFKSLRFNLTGQNLFLITDYSGIDPEVTVNTGQANAAALPSRAIDWTSFPNPLTVTFGVNASF